MPRLPADWSHLIYQMLWLGDLASIFTLHNLPFAILHSLLECPYVTSSVLYFVFFVYCVMSNCLAHLNNVVCTNDRILCIIFRHIFDQLILFILSFLDFC